MIEDCDAALAADTKYIKCFLRRAAAKFQLSRYSAAAVDYLTICAIEGPNSPTTQANMVKVEECAVAITQKVISGVYGGVTTVQLDDLVRGVLSR